MKIGIISAGQLGSAFAKLWTRAGHQVMVTNRGDLSKLESLLTELGSNGTAGQPQEVVQFADVIFLSILWKKLDEVLERTGYLDGKIVIDAINPLTTKERIAGAPVAGENEHFFEELGTSSTSDAIIKHSPGARIVKTLNQIGAYLVEQGPESFGANKPTYFYCGDDPEAKRVVAQLIEDLGFPGIDAGPLKSAYLLETLPKLYHQIVEANGYSDFGFTISRLVDSGVKEPIAK